MDKEATAMKPRLPRTKATEAQIRAKLRETETDERLWYPCATVFGTIILANSLCDRILGRIAKARAADEERK